MKTNPYLAHPHRRSSSYRQAIASLLLWGLIGCQITPTRSPETSNASAPADANTQTTTTASTPTNSSSKPKVVVTHNVLCDLTKQIAADTIDLVCLLAPGKDPHVYKLTPEDRQAIERAKLLIYGGYDLEPDLIKAIKASSNPAPKVAVNELAVPKPQQFTEEDHHDESGHSHGHNTIDPHVWHNAQNGAKMTDILAKNLAKIAPDRATAYQENAQKVAAELTQLDTWIKAQINTIPADKRTVFTNHDALGYYSQAYGVKVDALEGISTEEKPTAAKAKELVDKIKKAKVPTIYAETNLNPKLIESVANAANVKVSPQEIYADGLGAVGSDGETYQKMLVANTKTIVEGLGGKYTPFAKN